jgi:methyl-accepting chemotaxis protein
MNQYDPRKQRKIRNLLLDKRFQLKYTLAVVAVTGLVAITLGFFLFRSHQETSRVALVGLGDDPAAMSSEDQAMYEELSKEDRKVLLVLVAFLGGMVLVMTGLGIVATHKIAGPAFALRRNLSRIADGELPEVRALRPGDELQSVGEELQRMLGTLREREHQDAELLERAVQALARLPGAEPALLEALEGARKAKQTRLG